MDSLQNNFHVQSKPVRIMAPPTKNVAISPTKKTDWMKAIYS